MRLVRKAEGSAIRPTYGRTLSARSPLGVFALRQSTLGCSPYRVAQVGLRPRPRIHHTIQVARLGGPQPEGGLNGSLPDSAWHNQELSLSRARGPSLLQGVSDSRGTVPMRCDAQGASDGPRARRQSR